MRIVCIRHGRTEDDEKNIHQSPKSKLSDLGRKQARLAGEKLKDERFDLVFVSPYERTRETWKEISTHHSELEPAFEELIVEVDAGIYKGTKRGPMQEAIKKADLPFGQFKPAEGESFTEVMERAQEFWKQLKKADAESLLVVGHGGFLSLLYLHIEGLPLTKENYDAYHATNTAITVIEKEGEVMEIISLNDTMHLEQK